MTFNDLQDAVIFNLFDETERANVKAWINHRYGIVLAVGEWAFLNGTAAVGTTASSMVVSSVPADFGIAVELIDASGNPLKAERDWRRFYDRYQGADSGTPEAFTVVNGQVLVGPKASATETGWLLLYEKDPVPLSADGDVPILPELFHMTLVHGGRAEGMKLQMNPAWRDVEQDFLQSIDAMKAKYLVEIRQAGTQSPAYRVG